MLDEYTVRRFLDELASGEPTPGGGGAAAVTGAMGAALLSMVCNLTIGKKAYASVESEMRETLARTESLRARLQGMIQADMEVFDRVMAAYARPRGSEEEKRDRTDAIQSSLKDATLVPLDCARACAELIELATLTAEKGNENVVSDAGVGVVTAYAALRSAALNVYINTASITDEGFCREQLEALEAILERAGHTSEGVYRDVVRRLG